MTDAGWTDDCPLSSLNDAPREQSLPYATALCPHTNTSAERTCRLAGGSLQQLWVHRILNVQPLLGLTQLQDLQINFMVAPVQLQQLAGAIGSPLASVRWSNVPKDVAKSLLSEQYEGTLPLTELCLLDAVYGDEDGDDGGDDGGGGGGGDGGAAALSITGVHSVAHLGQWRMLRELAFVDTMEIAETPEQLAMQLQQLTCLTSLVLTANVGGSHTATPCPLHALRVYHQTFRVCAPCFCSQCAYAAYMIRRRTTPSCVALLMHTQ